MPEKKIAQRLCLSCGAALRGRIDKKFCNDYCRNNYNNQMKSNESRHPLVRNINNALLKNRKILAGLLPDSEDNCKVSKEKMQQSGFLFKYITHFYTTKTGKTYYFCYDYGYLPLDNDWYLLVRKRED
ncbi:MAG: hypothetical protein N2747_04885 [Chitinophagaceae bacterium]|nr:hypothetical protein [Chitinophagaceae bacterium]